MDYQTVVEGWLAEASLPGRLPRRFGPNGQWTVNVGGTTMTMAVDSARETLYFCATLFKLEGDEPAAFLRRLLVLQSEPVFPAGFALTLETESNTLLLFGRFALGTLNAASFNTLLTDTFARVETLTDKIREARRTLAALEAAAAGVEGKTNDPAPTPSPDRRPADPAEIDYDELSDEELLRLQIMQSMRV